MVRSSVFMAWIIISLLLLHGTAADRHLVSPGYATAADQSNKRVEVIVDASDFEISTQIELDANAGNLAHLKPADVLGVRVPIPTAGLYRVEARMSNPNGKGAFWVYQPDTTQVVFQAESLAITRDWNSWATVRLGMMDLSDEGSTELHLLIREGGFNLSFLSFTLMSSAMAAYFGPTPWGGARVIPATSYSSASSDVIIEAPLGGIENVGSIGNGASIQYDIVDLPSSASSSDTLYYYSLELGLSSPTSRGHIVVLDRTTGLVLAEMATVVDTNGWYTWQIAPLDDSFFTIQDTTLSIELVAVQGGFNLLYLALLPVATTTTVKPTPSPYKLFRWAADVIEYDGVDIHPTHDSSGNAGPDNLANLDDHDWFAYQLDLPVAGDYTLSMGVASGWSGGGAVEIVHEGRTLGAITDMPATTSWRSWSRVQTSKPIPLPQGSVVLQLRVTTGGWNCLWIILEEAR